MRTVGLKICLRVLHQFPTKWLLSRSALWEVYAEHIHTLSDCRMQLPFNMLSCHALQANDVRTLHRALLREMLRFQWFPFVRFIDFELKGNWFSFALSGFGACVCVCLAWCWSIATRGCFISTSNPSTRRCFNAYTHLIYFLTFQCCTCFFPFLSPSLSLSIILSISLCLLRSFFVPRFNEFSLQFLQTLHGARRCSRTTTPLWRRLAQVKYYFTFASSLHVSLHCSLISRVFVLRTSRWHASKCYHNTEHSSFASPHF